MDFVTATQVLGNIGEFVGAIAVVVTLGYLAVQVREAKSATESNTKQLTAVMESEMTSHWLSTSLALANDGQLSDIFYRTMTDPESVTPQDRTRLFNWAVATLKTGEFAFNQGKAGSLHNHLWEANHSTISTVRAIPRHPVNLAWPKAKHMFSLDYQSYVDSLIPAETK